MLTSSYMLCHSPITRHCLWAPKSSSETGSLRFGSLRGRGWLMLLINLRWTAACSAPQWEPAETEPLSPLQHQHCSWAYCICQTALLFFDLISLREFSFEFRERRRILFSQVENLIRLSWQKHSANSTNPFNSVHTRFTGRIMELVSTSSDSNLPVSLLIGCVSVWGGWKKAPWKSSLTDP